MPAKTLTLPAALCLLTALTACGDASAPADRAPLPPLPAAALRRCPEPAGFVPGGPAGATQAEVEIALGRMGDALGRCGAEKAALAGWAAGLRADLGAD